MTRIPCDLLREFRDGSVRACPKPAGFSIGDAGGRHMAGACRQHLIVSLEALYRDAEEHDLLVPLTVIPVAA